MGTFVFGGVFLETDVPEPGGQGLHEGGEGNAALGIATVAGVASPRDADEWVGVARVEMERPPIPCAWLRLRRERGEVCAAIGVRVRREWGVIRNGEAALP